MTRFAVLTEELYRLSRSLENYNKFNMFLVSQQNALIRALSAMDFLASCIGMNSISDDKAHVIIDTLENILHIRYFDFASGLLKAEAKTDLLSKQQELSFELSNTISLCIGELCNKNKNYKESVRRYIAVLQITSRALLPHTHKAWLSAEEAIRITQTHLKCD